MIKYFFYFLILISVKSYSQNLQWALDFQDTSVRWGETIGFDSNSNVFMAFPFGGSNDADPSINQSVHISNGVGDTCIAKYSPNGQYLWSVSFGGNSQDIPHKLVVDNDNNVIVIGHFTGVVDFDSSVGVSNINSSGGSIYIVKYDSNGNFIWARSFGNSTTYAYSIDVDVNNNIYLAGAFNMNNTDFDVSLNSNLINSFGGNDIYILKLNSNGVNIFTKQIGSVSQEFIYDIKVDELDNYFCIIGAINGSVDFDIGSNENIISAINGNNLVIAKYDLDANFLWAKSFENVNSDSSIIGNKINFDSSNNIFFSGCFYNNVDFDPDLGQAVFSSTPISTVVYEDSFICKLDSNGNYIATKTLSSVYQDKVIDFGIDYSNNLYLVGDFKGLLNFDLNNTNYSLTSLGEYDSYFMKLDNNLNFNWAHRIGNNQNDDRIKDICIDYNNDLIISGDYKLSIDVDFSINDFIVASNNSSYDAYLIKYDNLNLLELDSYTNELVTLYPNPCEEYLNFSGKTNIGEIEIINLLGQKCLSKTINLEKFEINVSSLKNGFYYVVYKVEDEIYKIKIYKK